MATALNLPGGPSLASRQASAQQQANFLNSTATPTSTVMPGRVVSQTDKDAANQALGKSLPVVIGTGRVDGIYFVGGVTEVDTVTTSTSYATSTYSFPNSPLGQITTINYGGQSGSGGTVLSPNTFTYVSVTPTTTSTTTTTTVSMCGYVLAYDPYEEGYDLIRLEIDGVVVFDSESAVATSTAFRFYGGRHTSIDPILTGIIGPEVGAYQNFVMVFIDGYPSERPPSISAVISNAATDTPEGGVIQWTGVPPTTGPFPPGVSSNYPHGASYDPTEAVIYQIIDGSDIAGLTHVYLAVLDVDTLVERYRVPLEGSEAHADAGDYQLSVPMVMPGTGFVLVHLISAIAGNKTAIYEAQTGRLVALHADTFNTEWREVLQLGTRWIYFGIDLDAGDAVAGVVDFAAGTLDVDHIGSGMIMGLVTRGRTTPASVSFFVVVYAGGSSYDIHEAVYNGTAWTMRHVIAPASTGSPITAVISVIWFDPLTGYFIFLERIGSINRFRYVNPDTGAVAQTFDATSGQIYINNHNLVPPLRLVSRPGFLLMQQMSGGNNIDLLDIQAKTISPFISNIIAVDYARFCRVIIDQSRLMYITAETGSAAGPAASNWTVWRIMNTIPGLVDLDDIVTDAMYLAGFGPPDLTFEGFSGLASYGFTIASDTTIQNVVRSIADIYGFAWTDTGSGFYLKKAGQGALLAIDAAFTVDDIVERSQPVQTSDEANIRTPSSVELSYISKEGAYKSRPASFNLTTGVLNSITTPTLSTPILLNDLEAQRIVTEKFFEFQENRRNHSLIVAPEHIVLLPGDIVSFPSGNISYTARIEQIAVDLRNMGVEISARDFQTEVETTVTAVSNNAGTIVVISAASQYIHLDVPLLAYADDRGGTGVVQYGMIAGKGQAAWSGAWLYRGIDAVTFSPVISQIPHQGVVGVAASVLNPPIDPFALDDASTVIIRKTNGSAALLVDATEAEVLAGENNAFIGAPGRWEWVGYKTVNDNGNGTWTLSGFSRRGYRGSEVFCALHELGDSFVLIDPSWLKGIVHPVTDLGDTLYYRAVGAGQDPFKAVVLPYVITGAAETPYAPLNLDAIGVGVPPSIDISWDYRSRLEEGINPSDSGEATLAFEIDIYDGATYKRTLTSTTNIVNYARVDILSDFGADPDELYFRVFMMSALPILVPGQERPVAGRGYEARGYVNIAGSSINAAGQALTVLVGDVTINAVVSGAAANVTGQSVTASVGTVTVSTAGAVSANVTGQVVTASIGTATVTVAGGTTAAVTGQDVTVSVGTVTVDTPAASAFPFVAASNTSSHTVNTTSHQVALPTGIAAGNLLLIFCRIGHSLNPITTPSGWTLLGSDTAAGTTSIFYRVADGSESSPLTVTSSSSHKSAHVSYRITGYQGVPEFASGGNSVDPPNLTPTWGSADTLWFAAISASGADTSQTLITAAPASYGNLLQPGSGEVSSSVRMGVARRELTGASEDPGAFTLVAAPAKHVFTVAVRPATAATNVSANVTGQAMTASVGTVTVTTSAAKVVTYKGQAISASDLTTYTFSSLDLGSAAADNRVHVGITGTTGTRTISSVTIGGVTATQNIVQQQGNTTTGIYTALVPAGGTGSIVVTWSGGQVRCGITWWSSTGLTSDTAVGADAGANAVGNLATDLNVDVTTAAGGFILVFGNHNNASGGGTITYTPSAIVQDGAVLTVETTMVIYAAHGATDGSTFDVRTSAIGTSSTSSAICAASF